MARWLFGAGWLALACALVACTTVEDRVSEHQRRVRSLASTTTVVTDAWLSGRVSGTFAATALSSTLVLVDRERATFGTDVEVLSDPAGGLVSEETEQLARQLSSIIEDVQRGNGTAVRHRLAELPFTPAVPR
jgi:hypothetical protein